MKIIAMLCLSALSFIVNSRANSTISDADAAQLTAKYNCQACHQVDKQLVGPAFRDIAKKYKADAVAVSKLQVKVKNGSSGVWGAIAMPPNNVPSADLQALVEWVMSLKTP
jgi:cytochrome c